MVCNHTGFLDLLAWLSVAPTPINYLEGAMSGTKSPIIDLYCRGV